MRVAIVTHNVIRGDGQGRSTLEIAKYVAQRGAQVTLISDRVDEDLQREPNIKWIPLQPRIRSNWLMHGTEFHIRSSRLLKKLRGQFDIVHGYGYTLDVPHQVNTSQFVHSTWRQSPMHPARNQRNFNGAYQWTYSLVNSIGEKKAFARAERVVAASRTVAAELRSIGVPDSKLRVIPNGVDLGEFTPRAEDRASLNLPVGVPLALFAGDIRSSRKNLDTVLKALPQNETVHLAVVGSTEGSPYPQMAGDLGVSKRVHFLGYRRDIARIMRASDLFVFPTRYEPFGMVVIEAMASGLPVITSASAGVAEAVTPESGFLMDDPNDVDFLSRSIAAIVGDAELHRSLSRAAIAQAQKYSWDTIGQAYQDLYKEFAA